MTFWIQWSMGVGMPNLEIGWEVICDVLSMSVPGSQERGKNAVQC